MKTQLTNTINNYLTKNLNIYLDDSQNWTVQEMLKQVHEWGIKKGKEQKADEIKEVLNIK
jgi:uncharacterized protein (DUF1786 family)